MQETISWMFFPYIFNCDTVTAMVVDTEELWPQGIQQGQEE
jgi:hypothetical protein